MQASVAVASAILDKDETHAPLALCVLHCLQDDRFRELLDAVVELNPDQWPAVHRYIAKLSDAPVDAAR